MHPDMTLGELAEALDHKASVPTVWRVVLLLMAPAGSLVRGQRARRRSKRGLCVFCGYDLRASPGRCPECGAVAGGSGA